MRVIFSLSVLFLAFVKPSSGQSPSGYYSGALTRDGSVQLIHLTFTDTTAVYDIPELGLYNIKSEKYHWKNDTLNLQLYYGTFYCFIDRNTGDVSGISQSGTRSSVYI